MNPIKHVAIIMDGNGRWGIKHKGSRNLGHRAGLNSVESVIDISIKEKINYLTLFTFSTENWKRPKKEIDFLFKLLENFLTQKIENLVKEKELSEDDEKKNEKIVQTFTDEHIKMIDHKVEIKEKEIMTI